MNKGIEFEVNNGQTLFLTQVSKDGDTMLNRWDGEKMEFERRIPAGDMVMLLNYYRYIKDNDIKDDFINYYGRRVRIRLINGPIPFDCINDDGKTLTHATGREYYDPQRECWRVEYENDKTVDMPVTE